MRNDMERSRIRFTTVILKESRYEDNPIGKMDDLLVPDTPAGQRSNDAPEEIPEPSCCSPIRSKLKTSRIKLFSVIHIVCGVLSIGLGIVACIFGCVYNGVSIVAGVAFIATGVVGMCVRKHGAMAVVYGLLSLFSCLSSIAVAVCMLAALPEREGEWDQWCSSYDCKNSPYDYPYRDDNCCVRYKNFLMWKNVAIDVSILVVGVVELVASFLATTLSLRDTNWIRICCLKKNMPAVSDTVQTTRADSSDERSALSGQPPAMKRCWKPCEGKGHRNATIVLSVIHIIIGFVSVALGIAAVFVEGRNAHIGIPIWSGLLIFVVTGIYGLLSATKKGSYIPCFFSLSILAFLLSINMYIWAANNKSEEDYHHYKYGCIDWSCPKTTTTTSSYHYYCYDCLPGCCNMGDISDDKAEFIRVSVDSLTVGFGVLEMLICMATFGLSFSQISCYICCRNSSCCSCCQPKTNDQFQMVMTSDGNLMMVAVPNTQRGMPTMVHNQPMMVQHQPTMIPNQLIVAQNQPTAAQGLPSLGTPQTSGTGALPQPQGHGAQQPVIIQAQRQPMMVQGHGQLMTVGGQGQPMLVQGQGQPMLVQAQGQPMMVQQGQGQPMIIQQPMFVQGMGQVATAQSQGQPTNQPVMVPAQGQPAHTMIQAQAPNPLPQTQCTGELVDGGEARVLVAGQEAGNISNPTV